ncbi:MAG: hypothetical protein EXR59_00860 [Dehalococcoidia bacterium]|nr:hypothetical protein [Dehalococcoidia bacterium]
MATKININERRIYALDSRSLSQEQIAVTFAMTSRRPEAFDEISRMVTDAKAADFNERWVLNYGHSSVAEHAVLHMAVENISRLAADDVEDNRLAAYTEKSSRYQVLENGTYYTPKELAQHPGLEATYKDACASLFAAYEKALSDTIQFLKSQNPQKPDEKDGAYNLRLRRIATDHCRFILPASTLTNVGMTINSRALEHAITKLLSSELEELREIGQELKEQGRKMTPTLVKYADRNEYIVGTRQSQKNISNSLPAKPLNPYAKLVQFDANAERRIATALLYRFSNEPYEVVRKRIDEASQETIESMIDDALKTLGAHDVPVRELESIDYTFEFLLDYGAYRELKRHRMMSYIAQPATVAHGYLIPDLIEQGGLFGEFKKSMDISQQAFDKIYKEMPAVAPYVTTHAHLRRVICKMNLRECYHLFKLRTGPDAHFTLRKVMMQALGQAKQVHPLLFKHLRLR